MPTNMEYCCAEHSYRGMSPCPYCWHVQTGGMSWIDEKPVPVDDEYFALLEMALFAKDKEPIKTGGVIEITHREYDKLCVFGTMSPNQRLETLLKALEGVLEDEQD